MSASLQKSWPSKRDSEDLIRASWPRSQQGKRKRQSVDKQELWPSDRRLKLISLDEEDRKPPKQILDPKETEAIQIPLSPKVSDVAFKDLTTDDDLLPELTHEISSTPDSEDAHLLDGFNQYKSSSLIDPLHGPKHHQDKVRMLDDDALFSEFLRSPSPSLSHNSVGYVKDDPQTSMLPQTIVPADVCQSREGDPHLADLAAEDILDFQHGNVQTKRKPHVTLHVRPAKAVIKRKVSLRLNPPKKAPKQAMKRAPKPSSMRPGPRIVARSGFDIRLS